MLSKDIIEWFRLLPAGKRTGNSPCNGCETFEMADYQGFFIRNYDKEGNMLVGKYEICNDDINSHMELDSTILEVGNSDMFYEIMNLHIKQLGLSDFYN